MCCRSIAGGGAPIGVSQVEYKSYFPVDFFRLQAYNKDIGGGACRTHRKVRSKI